MTGFIIGAVVGVITGGGIAIIIMALLRAGGEDR